MRAIFFYGLQDLAQHKKLWLAMSLLVGVTILFFLAIYGIRAAISEEVITIPFENLIVQKSNVLGELYGSRMPASVEADLLAMGVSQAIPEIHEYAGTSRKDTLLLRGIDLKRYQQVNSFKMLAGEALQPGEPTRTAMIGRRLADKFNLSPGQEILIRGRKFRVKGIFHTGTYVDNEAWISLQDAQALFGWGEDVSLYIIPDERILMVGDTLPGGMIVVRRGQGMFIAAQQFDPILKILDIVARALGVAGALALTNTLIRLAWLRRRELAILLCVGFRPAYLYVYLLTQALAITLAGALLGAAGISLAFAFLRIDAAGISIQPALDAPLLLSGLALVTAITLLGTLVPVAWLNRIKPAVLLRAQS
jgi:ABC-type lipoprotein release transport system permease subunit